MGCLLYANSLRTPFQFDDKEFIVDNPAIRNLNNFEGIWKVLSQPSRFVGLYTFALNYHFHHYDVLGYHAVNLAIHGGTAVLVWVFTRLILGLWPPGNTGKKEAPLPQKKNIIALTAALLYVAHPVQTQAVTYITQRFESLATLFYLAALCCYIKGRLLTSRAGKGLKGFIFFLSAALLAVLGMFTKEVVMTLPLTVLLFEIYFLNEAGKEKRRGSWRGIGFGIILLFILIVPALFSFDPAVLLSPRVSESHDGEMITLDRYFLTQFRVLAVFLRLFIFPAGQNLDYDFPLSQSLFEPTTFFSFLGVVGVLSLALIMKSKDKLISFGLLWFFLTLSVGFVPRSHIIFEHKLYLASVGLCVALAWGLARCLKDTRLFAVVTGVLLILLSFLTIQRNKVWRSEIVLWQDVVQKSPHKSRGYLNLGIAYLDQGQYDLALKYLQKSAALHPRRAKVYNNIGNVYSRMNKFDLAILEYNKALALDRSNLRIYSNRGYAYLLLKQYPQALADFNQAIALKPSHAEQAYNNRGNVYDKLEKYDLALADYNQAIARNPLFAKAYNNRGCIYLVKKQYQRALDDFRRALELDPDYGITYNNRGSIYRELGQYDLALADMNKAIHLNPGHAEAYLNRGLVYNKIKEFGRALADLDKASELMPQDPRVFFHRGVTHVWQKAYESAIGDFSNALTFDPDLAVAYYNRSLTYRILGDTQRALEDALKAESLGYNVDRAYLDKLRKSTGYY
ncbi:MAG: hypothetical protein A2Z81_03680 [Omnitrophica WOR_2 bacterium GWA2_45_18]|nr:MAG: hypothetical protein A2Z81_03680 [Omnitrophica WOR_2 bacterium GWA2_45_18]